MKIRFATSIAFGLAFAGCGGTDDDPADGNNPPAATTYRGVHAMSVAVAANDNPEVVAWLPGKSAVMLASSTSRRITEFAIENDALVEKRSQALFTDDASESELTSLAVAPDASWGVLTRTIVEKDMNDETTGCAGELVFVSFAEDMNFGQVLAQVAVGPMPDAVAISPDGTTVAVANERDAVWGKCEGVMGLEPGSVSLVDVAAGPAAATETARITLGDDAREPESLVFSSAGDRLVVTLQDSHELAFIELGATPTASYVSVPANSLGTDPWPDGVTRFSDANGRDIFATAGEASDTISMFDRDGANIATVEVLAADVPSDLPRLSADDTWGPLFRPDSITSFGYGDKAHIVVSLKSSGALAVWEVADPSNAVLRSVIRVGRDLGADAESVGTEGVAAGPDGAIVAANEAEGTVSLVLPSAI